MDSNDLHQAADDDGPELVVNSTINFADVSQLIELHSKISVDTKAKRPKRRRDPLQAPTANKSLQQSEISSKILDTVEHSDTLPNLNFEKKIDKMIAFDDAPGAQERIIPRSRSKKM